MLRRLAAAAALALAALLAMTGAVAHAQPASFAYDATAPMKIDLGPARPLAPGVWAADIRFSSPTGHTITGELIHGPGEGPRPGVLFVHWLGDPKTTNHTEFEPDAIALAKRGATSLLVDAMWSKSTWFDSVGKVADDDIKVTADQVIDLRRSLDFLASQPGVQPDHIAYVAHDFGAMMGALLAGADARPSYYVLMAGVPTLSEWYLLGKKAPEGYAARLDGALDLSGSLGRLKAKAVLFQFATHDHYIAADRAAAFMATAPTPKGVFWYDTDHALAVPDAFDDRQAWLVEKLFGGRW